MSLGDTVEAAWEEGGVGSGHGAGTAQVLWDGAGRERCAGSGRGVGLWAGWLHTRKCCLVELELRPSRMYQLL